MDAVAAACVPLNVQQLLGSGDTEGKQRDRAVWGHTAVGMLLCTMAFPAFSFHPKRWILTSFSLPDLEQKQRDGHRLGTGGSAGAALAPVPSL